MLLELRSSRLHGHDVCDVFACLDICNQNDIALHTLVNKANFDCYMFHSLVRKILSPSIGNSSCIVNPHTGAIDHCLVLLSALQIEQYCPHVLYFTTNFASTMVSAIAVHSATVDCRGRRERTHLS
jgi:hypothetical protein